MTQPYKYPPAVEAIIEVRFAAPIERDVIDKVPTKLKSEYPLSVPQQAHAAHVNFLQRTATFEESLGHRLSTHDQTDIIIVTPLTFTSARLAPYLGWEVFGPRAEKNWKNWKQIAGYHQIQKIGVRYKNRIDIPVLEGVSVHLEDYLKFYPEYPKDSFPAMTQFAMQMICPLGVDDCNVQLNVLSIPSPLLKHASFLFDLDIYKDVNVPQNDDEIWSLIKQIRDQKNRVFELGVTDKARALFSHE